MRAATQAQDSALSPSPHTEVNEVRLLHRALSPRASHRSVSCLHEHICKMGTVMLPSTAELLQISLDKNRTWVESWSLRRDPDVCALFSLGPFYCRRLWWEPRLRSGILLFWGCLMRHRESISQR